MNFKYVVVTWKDAHGMTGQVNDQDVFSRMTTMILTSCGFLVLKDGERVVIAQDRIEKEGDWRNLLCIPWLNIVSITVLSETKDVL